MKIILASASPRRKELLSRLGWEFEVCVSDAEEKITKSDPGEIVEELSALKAKAVFDKLEGDESGDILVIGSDTVVAYEGKILGKPVDAADAVRMLKMLQGKTHEVYTGVTMHMQKGGKEIVKTFHESAEVTFYPMSQEEIDWYVASLEPMDKAGAYGIQGLGGRFVKGIRGDYSTIVGLPAARLYQEWKKLNENIR